MPNCFGASGWSFITAGASGLSVAGDSASTSRDQEAHLENLYGFLGKGFEGRVSLNLLPLNMRTIVPGERDRASGTQDVQAVTSSGASCSAATSMATASST